MELGPTLEQRPTVTPQLVMANELLQFSSVELEQAIAQEISENPALELREARLCPRCGLAMPDGYCPSCGGLASKADEEGFRDRLAYEPGGASFSEPGLPDEWDDPLSRLAASTTLADHLLHQARLNLPPQDLPIVACLVDSLDDRGFLRCDLDDVVDAFGVNRERVEGILSVIQRLDPVGIGARDAREGLLIQLEHLCQEGAEQPLARALIEQHWEMLGRYSLARIARETGTSTDDVRAALSFIKENLNPFPAHASWADPHQSPPRGDATSPTPDVIIREAGDSETVYEIELPRAGKYRLAVSASYLAAMKDLGADSSASAGHGRTQWEEFRARARLFVRSIEQRWQTLYDLMRCLVDCQRDFLVDGEKRLKPLTRAQVADMMDVHESTVSRAVADKYVQLPGGRVVPLAKFFDSAAPIKRTIEELIAQESEPLSDREIAERLAQRGYDVARRTVAKYRDALSILPSSLRRREKELSIPQD